MATNHERQQAANERHHLQYVYGELKRHDDALRFLCKDVDAPEVKDAVYRAITALGEAQTLMRSPRGDTSGHT